MSEGEIEKSAPKAAARIKHPALLVLAILIVIAAAIAAISALAQLAMDRAAAPVVLVAEKQALDDALEDAPWVSSGDEGQVVWMLTSTDCAACRAFEGRDLDKLLSLGVEVRVILTSPRKESLAASDVFAATLAQQRDWRLYDSWRGAGGQSSAAAEMSGDPEREGYLEWGRASRDRVARVLWANNVPMSEPVVLWRRGVEWRAAIGADAAQAARAIGAGG